MKQHVRILLVTGVLMGTLLSIGVSVVRAQSQEGITIDPPIQEVQLAAEMPATTASIVIKNTSSVKQHVTLRAIDFEQIDSLGNIRFTDKPLTAAEFTLARFITFPEQSLELEPQQTKEVTAAIANSLELSPGTHYAAALFQFRPETQSEQTHIIPAVSSMIILTKQGGELYRLNIPQVRGIPSLVSVKHAAQLKLEFENGGNTHVTPRGTVTGQGLGERLIFKGIINESSALVLPQNRRLVSVNTYQTARALPFDFITVTIEGTAQGTSERYFWSSSYVYVNAWILGAILSIPLLLLIIRRFKYVQKR